MPLFWALTSSYFPFVMVIPRALTRSIDIKLGVFPEGTSIFDTAKARGRGVYPDFWG